MRIFGMTGNLRRGSHNLTLLRAAAAELPPDAQLEEFAGLGDVRACSEDLDNSTVPRAVQRLPGAITAADALIIATPECNGSVPGALKNALDWASRP
jgi:chromate reductase, NAD(P)H dehydrogenase (quinone)